MFRYTALAGVGMVVLFLVYISTDESYQMDTIQVYMVDYLQNMCSALSETAGFTDAENGRDDERTGRNKRE